METESKFPSTICVSELLRTWETAILLFLSLKTTLLTLFISPFLREDGKLPSDIPNYLQDQIYEFMRFLVFLGQLKKFTETATEDIQDLFSWIPDNFTIRFKHYAGSFTQEFISGIQKIKMFKLSIRDGALEIECDISSKSISLDAFVVDGMLPALKELFGKILEINGLNDDESNSGDGKYKKFNDNIEPQLKYPDPFPIPRFDKTDLNKVSSPPSIRTFADWCKSNLTHIQDSRGIVYFVSHSHIMQSFVKDIIKMNGQDTPTDSFMENYNIAKKTNSWSLFFNVDGVKFKGFRHAFSCDNRYQAKGFFQFFRRWRAGNYTNLALWGILSTAKFAEQKIPGLLRDTNPCRLKVSIGMKKEPKELVTDKYDKYNMLCGTRDDRVKMGNFEITMDNCGTSSKLTLTRDKDCIKIKFRKNDGTFDPKKVVLQLSKNNPRGIEVKFFKDDSNTYIPPPDEVPTTSLLKIISFLTGIPIPVKSNNDEDDSYDELKGLTLEMTEAISNFIKSDEFTRNESHKDAENPKTWDDIFAPFYQEILDNTADVIGLQGGGETKKYYTHQSRKKSRRHFQRRKKTHRRKSRRSRK
jgi:hypothetical protein